MNAISIPRNLLIADRVALGLTRAQLLTVGAAVLIGYGGWRLFGSFGLVMGAVAVGAGVLLAIVSVDGSPLQDWALLAIRWLPKRRPLLLEVDPCN